MDFNKRKFFKFAGLTALSGAALASIPVIFTGPLGVLSIKPKGKKTNLIIDPRSDNFVYIDGFIVKAGNKQ